MCLWRLYLISSSISCVACISAQMGQDAVQWSLHKCRMKLIYSVIDLPPSSSLHHQSDQVLTQNKDTFSFSATFQWWQTASSLSRLLSWHPHKSQVHAIRPSIPGYKYAQSSALQCAPLISVSDNTGCLWWHLCNSATVSNEGSECCALLRVLLQRACTTQHDTTMMLEVSEGKGVVTVPSKTPVWW